METIMNRSEELLQKFESVWSGSVVAKWHPSPELFAKGTARQIAEAVHVGHKTLQSAVASINFYLSRGGKNIKTARKKVIEQARELLHKMYNK